MRFLTATILALGLAAPAYAQPSPEPGQKAKSMGPRAGEETAAAYVPEETKAVFQEANLLPAGTIKDLQRALNYHGMYLAAVDGIVGPATKRALRDFQKATKLEVTGRLTAETVRSLGVNLPGSETLPVGGARKCECAPGGTPKPGEGEATRSSEGSEPRPSGKSIEPSEPGKLTPAKPSQW